MAKALNKDRVRDSRIIAAATVVLFLFSSTLIPVESMAHESFEYAGYFLVTICALGRVYTSAFLGGYKNEQLITYGPFSIVRNPLYFFSLVGIAGLSMMTSHLLFMVFNPVLFYTMYTRLIKREEGFLLEKFGSPYRDYLAAVPRLMPRFSLYHAPEEIHVQPHFVNKALMDAIWWFVPYPLFELIELLHEKDILPTLLLIP